VRVRGAARVKPGAMIRGVVTAAGDHDLEARLAAS